MQINTPNLSRWRQERISVESFFRRHRELETKLFARLDMSGNKRTATLRNLMTGEQGFGLPSAFMSAVTQLKHTAFGDLLQAAERENSPEAEKQLLTILLLLLGVKDTEGVFKLGNGRPISNQAAEIYSTWLRLGKPSPSTSEFALEVFGPAFNSANGLGRRRMRDQCRQAVRRYVNRLANRNSLPD